FGLAPPRSILDRLDVPEDLIGNYREIELSAKRRLSPSDPASAFTLHKIYPHVDIVHGHGLHAATLTGLGFTGLPARLSPTAVATVENFAPADVIEKTGAEIVARTARGVLGTTEPVVEWFAGSVPLVERAELVTPDIDTDLTVTASRAQVR
ncbi:group 1 glycosyl transferase, partial [Burkholderia multivorans]